MMDLMILFLTVDVDEFSINKSSIGLFGFLKANMNHTF